MPDGSIRIKTKLDNSGIDKDVQTLENKIKKLQLDNKKSSEEQSFLQKEIDNYEKLQKEANEYKNQIKEIKKEKLNMKKIPKQDMLINNEEYMEIQKRIQKIKQEYLKAIEDIKHKYKSKKRQNIEFENANKLYTPQLHELIGQRDQISLNVLPKNTEKLNSKINQVKQQYVQVTTEIDKQASKIDKVYAKLDKVKTKQQENNAKMEEYKQRIEEARNKQKQLNINTDGIGKSVGKGIKQILKYSMTLMGIQSIYGALTGAMNSWLSGNNKGARQLKSDIEYMKNAVGEALSPILKYIVNLLYKALGFTGALIKAFTGIDIFAGSIANYMSSTTSSANKTNKELKKQLASFDEINVLQDNSNNSGSTGGGGTPLPSQNLSTIMAGYTEIAEKIKGKFDEIKDLIPIIGAGILAWKLSDLFFSQLSGINSLKAKIGLTLVIAGLYLLYNGVTRMLNGDLSLESILMALGGGTMTTVGIATLLKMLKNGQMFSWGQALKIGFGITLAITGIMAEYNSVKKMLSGDISLGTILQATGSAFLIGLGTWITTGSLPAGLIVTAGALAINFTVELGIAIAKFINGTEEVDIKASNLTHTIKALNEELENNKKQYQNNLKSIDDTCEAQIVEAEYAKKLEKQLSGLVDANGKVVKGNESRIDFILGELSNALGIEVSRNGDLITKNGEVVKSYEDLQKSIVDTIEAKKKEAYQEAITEKYKESIKAQIQAERDLQKAKQTTAQAYKEYTELMSKGYSEWTLSHDENCKQILQNMVDTDKALQEMRQAYDDTTQDVLYYSQEMTDNIIENTGTITNEMIQQSQVSSNTLTTMVKENYNTWEENYNNLDKLSQNAILAQSTTLDTWSPQLQNKWKDMAENSSENFIHAISQVTPEVQTQILKSITTTDNMNPQLANAWSNLASKSYESFTEALNQVEPETQNEILKAIAKTEDLTPEMTEMWANLAITSKDKYNNVLSSLDEDTRGKIQSAVNAVNSKKPDVNDSFYSLAEGGKTSFATVDFASSGLNVVTGIVAGINANKYKINQAITGCATGAVSAFNAVLGIHSPSRVMAEQAKFIPLGIAEGIDSTQDKAIGSMKNMVVGMQETVDGMDYSNITQIPKVPQNAVTYIPKQAIKGEAMLSSTNNMDWIDALAQKTAQILSSNSTNNGGEIILKFDGSLAQFARIIKPELDKESQRRGYKLVRGGNA